MAAKSGGCPPGSPIAMAVGLAGLIAASGAMPGYAVSLTQTA